MFRTDIDRSRRDERGRPSRRLIMQAAIGEGCLLVLGGCAKEEEPRRIEVPTSALVHRGVNYDVGTQFGADGPARLWHSASMQRDVRAIRQDLHCNAIGVHGTEIARLVETAASARENGLEVWLQPRLFDVPADALLDHLADATDEAERLRRQYSGVHLNVGCEMTLLNSGFVPGATFAERAESAQSVMDWAPVFQKMNATLKQALTIARGQFGGPVTYGAGPWEWPAIDWSEFDFVGLDHYMDAENRTTYAEALRQFAHFERPVVVLEFGCCAYEGADDRGGMGWNILDPEASPPRLDGEYVRSEETQASYIDRLLDVFETEAVRGAFVYQFVSPDLPHAADPIHDLDMASYGLVKVAAMDETTGAYDWAPKLAFDQLARRYDRASR
jgi:hypothetical protein